MNILHVIPLPLSRPAAGGVLTYVRGLARAQAAAGHRVWTVSPAPSEDGTDGWERAVQTPPTGPFGFSRRLLRTLGMVRSTFAPAVAHVHCAFNYFSDGARMYFSANSVPVIQTPHGSLQRSDIHSKRRRLKTIYRRTVLPLWGRGVLFHFLSELELEDSVIPSGASAACVGPGVEVPDLLGAEKSATLLNAAGLGRLLDRPYILFMARISLHKGADLLLTAFEKHLSRDPRLGDVVLVMGGWEEDGILQHESKARPVWLSSDRVLVLGEVESLDLKEALYERAAVVAAPSRWESFGYSVVEAGLAQTPVVFGEAGLMANRWRDAGAVTTVAADVGDIADGLASVLSLPLQERTEIGKRARRYFASEYSWESAQARVVDLYTKAFVRA